MTSSVGVARCFIVGVVAGTVLQQCEHWPVGQTGAEDSWRAILRSTKAGEVTLCSFAQATLSASDMQQQLCQQDFASRQAQAQCWQGNSSDVSFFTTDVIGIPKPAAETIGSSNADVIDFHPFEIGNRPVPHIVQPPSRRIYYLATRNLNGFGMAGQSLDFLHESVVQANLDLRS